MKSWKCAAMFVALVFVASESFGQIQNKEKTMQTHEDEDARIYARKQFMEKLTKRAENAIAQGKSGITSGTPGEPVLANWTSGGMECVIRPSDPQGIVRISVGGGVDLVPLDYCVIRGEIGQCIALLEKAIAALARPDVSEGIKR